MSCCNPGPVVVKVYPNPPPVCPDTPEYVFENANLSGQGVFLSHTGTNVQFMGIASSGGTIDVTLDAPNNTINIEIDDAIVAGNFPDSTTTIKGKTAYSTNAEAIAKASTTKAVTPSNFAAMEASTTFSGFSERSTDAEALTGTSTAVVLTPSNLKYVTDRMLVTQSVANAGARGSTTPSAEGQLLVQRDTGLVYRAGSATIGDWDTAAIPTSGTVAVSGLTLTNSGGQIEITSGDWNSTMPVAFQGSVYFGDVVDFDVAGGAIVQRNGVAVPANSVLITGGTAGQISSSLINTFLSSANVTPEYAVDAYTENRSISAASTLADVIDFVSTLISDLSVPLKPNIGA